jgi:hypothetical protein
MAAEPSGGSRPTRRAVLRAGGLLVGAGRFGSVTAGREPSGSYRPLGEVEVPGTREAVVGDGDWVYLATSDGYAVVDASDPTDPVVAAAARDLAPAGGGAPLRRVWDVAYDDDRLLVAGQDDDHADATTGFVLVDVSDPASPERVLFESTSFPIHNCSLDATTAYLTDGPATRDTFTVYDLSGATATEVATWQAVSAGDDWRAAYEDGGPGAHDVWVDDGLAYAACWDAGVFVVDVSDVGAPQFVGRFGGLDPDTLEDMSDDERFLATLRPPGNAHFASTDETGDLAGVNGEAWTFRGEGGPMGIDLYDVSDLADPVHLSTVEPPASPDTSRDGYPTTAHNFELRDGTLYSSWYHGGVRRHDVSDPTAPVEETSWRRPRTASVWAARPLEPGSSFVASNEGVEEDGSDAGLYVFPDGAGTSVAPFEPTPTPTPTRTEPRTGTATPEAATTATATGTAPPTGAVTTPGFGIGAAVVGLCGAAYVLAGGPGNTEGERG